MLCFFKSYSNRRWQYFLCNIFYIKQQIYKVRLVPCGSFSVTRNIFYSCCPVQLSYIVPWKNQEDYVKLDINAFFFFLKHGNVLQKPQFCTARVSQVSYRYHHSLCATGNITNSQHLSKTKLVYTKDKVSWRQSFSRPLLKDNLAMKTNKSMRFHIHETGLNHLCCISQKSSYLNIIKRQLHWNAEWLFKSHARKREEQIKNSKCR